SAPTSDIVASLRIAANPLLRETFYRAWANASLTPAPVVTGIDALRLKAPLFGHNALPKPIYDKQGALEATEEWPLGETLVIVVRLVTSEGRSKLGFNKASLANLFDRLLVEVS